MATSFQHDRFDELPDDLQRVGAHRVPRKPGRRWVGFAWAALATVVLVGAGVVGLMVLNGQLDAGSDTSAGAPSASAPAATEGEAPVDAPPPVEPIVDPALAVTVLNGTPTTGVAGAVGDLLTEAGWTVATRSNAATEDFTTTTVYYGDPALEAAAKGIVLSLPNATIAQSDDFAELGSASLVVVVGSDYVLP